MDGHAGVAAGEVAHDLAEAAELLRGEVAARHVDVRRVEKPGWRCGGDVATRRRRRRRLRSPLGDARARRRGRRAGLLVVDEEVGREVALVDPVALELLLDLRAQLVDAELVDEDLDAGAGAVDAQPVLAVEDAEDRLGDLQVVAVVGARRTRRASGRCAA